MSLEEAKVIELRVITLCFAAYTITLTMLCFRQPSVNFLFQIVEQLTSSENVNYT